MDARLGRTGKITFGSRALLLVASLWTGLAATVPDPVSAQQVYIRKDADGRIHFSNAPTAPGYENSESGSQPRSRIVRETEPAQPPQHRPKAAAPVPATANNGVADNGVADNGALTEEQKAKAARDLEELMAGLSDPVTNVRYSAADQLGDMREAAKPAVAKLAEATKDPNDAVRNSAFIALTKIEPNDPSVLQAAIRGLGNGMDENGRAATSVSGYRDNSINYLSKRAHEALPGLLIALREPKEFTRMGAAQVLGNEALARDPEAVKLVVPALLNSLSDKSDPVRGIAASSLAAFPSAADQTFGPLVNALKDPYSWVRGGAAKALGAMGPRAAEAVPELGKLLQDREHSVRMTATAALTKIDSPEAQAELARALQQRNVVQK